MFKKIIVGLDGSDSSETSLRIGCELAQQSGGSLTLVHVPHAETAAFVVGAVAGYRAAVSNPTFEDIETAGQKVMDAAIATAQKAGCKSAKTHMPHGDAATEILRHADDIGADLIITGRRGLGGIASLVMGSTTQQINHHARCACLSVI